MGFDGLRCYVCSFRIAGFLCVLKEGFNLIQTRTMLKDSWFIGRPFESTIESVNLQFTDLFDLTLNKTILHKHKTLTIKLTNII